MYLQQDLILFSARFIALSVDHPLSKNFNKQTEFQSFKENVIKLAQLKALANTENWFDTKIFAEHPFIKKKIAVFFANFVLMDYGSGAIFGCPAHDRRDFDFAKKYKLEIIKVVSDKKSESILQEAYTGKFKIINSDFLNNLEIEKAKERVISEIEKNKIGKRKILYRLKDWGVSRQRYWGCPIPMIYLEDGSVVPVEKSELPVLLPEDIDLNSQVIL